MLEIIAVGMLLGLVGTMYMGADMEPESSYKPNEENRRQLQKLYRACKGSEFEETLYEIRKEKITQERDYFRGLRASKLSTASESTTPQSGLETLIARIH
jgi:hypothetical protein